MNLRKFAAVAIATAFVSSCGSVSRGTTEDVTIHALPDDASIRTSLGPGCPRSPCTFPVKRKDSFTAFAEREGYKPGSIQIKTEISGGGAAGFAGNVLLGGLIGMGVDAYNKSSYDHTPNPAYIILEPINPNDPKTPLQKAPTVVKNPSQNSSTKPMS
ncbi:translation initiation factor 2 [Agrobacterium vitis]|uniref:translation initiation factor 2 n=1 Tax=Agrobacterium vitis TaxID=373 RepID=UPI001F45FC60|nr:translation initiation factor 2 [Agrobacterium vitis]MCF1466817.1 translation initiation factor 2 [Agrobacterium vitis]